MSEQNDKLPGRDERAGAYEQWRVTGTPSDTPFRFVFDTEEQAREFCRPILGRDDWESGPFIHRRTVTYSEWEAR